MSQHSEDGRAKASPSAKLAVGQRPSSNLQQRDNNDESLRHVFMTTCTAPALKPARDQPPALPSAHHQSHHHHRLRSSSHHHHSQIARLRPPPPKSTAERPNAIFKALPHQHQQRQRRPTIAAWTLSFPYSSKSPPDPTRLACRAPLASKPLGFSVQEAAR